MARNYGRISEIRIPPQSTGPRILNHIYQSVTLSSIGGTVQTDYDIVGQTSGAIGTISAINGNDILVTFEPNSPVQSFTDGETVDINNAAFTAIVGSPADVYTNATQVVDADNPHRAQRVDADGSAHIRFGEGEQQLDAFGLTRVTQRTILDEFKFRYGKDPVGLEETVTGSASSTHLPNESSVTLDVTTSASDSIEKQSPHYYPYIAGVGREVIFTCALGDTGKANNARRFGLFDDQNGVFFELNGVGFSAVVRSNVTGSVVDTVIPIADWNKDTLDGSGGVSNRSNIDVDITNMNIWWIDYAWLGAGRVRFGVYAPDGERITCHTVKNSNIRVTPYMTSGSLPIRWENVNTGLTSGNSSIKITCAAVIDNAQEATPPHKTSYAYDRLNVTTTTETLMFNVRSAATFNSITNRIVSTGFDLSTVSETAPAIIRVYENATIGGSPVWNSAAGATTSPLEVDIAGTFSGGTLVSSFMVGVNQVGHRHLDFLELHVDAAGTSSRTFTVTATSLGASTEVSSSFSWTDRG